MAVQAELLRSIAAAHIGHGGSHASSPSPSPEHDSPPRPSPASPASPSVDPLRGAVAFSSELDSECDDAEEEVEERPSEVVRRI